MACGLSTNTNPLDGPQKRRSKFFDISGIDAPPALIAVKT